MFRLAAAILLSSVALAQTSADAEIALAAKSPLTLARYVKSHSTLDWRSLRSALSLKASEDWFAPCGSAAPANDSRCSAEIVSVADPEQEILIIRSSGDFSFTDEYLRYLRGPSRDWIFVGEISALKRNGPSDHVLVRLGTKPFLKISSDHSQNGVGVQQEREDWFDLTSPDFEPVFSFTPKGSGGGFGFTIAREIRAQSKYSQAAGVERIDTTLKVHFEGTPGLVFQGSYSGVYERRANQKKFTLLTAYSGLNPRATIPTTDFEDLSNPFADPANEAFMVYALPGLRRIASGSNAADRSWLRDFLDHTKDTPEKRTLQDLLMRP